VEITSRFSLIDEFDQYKKKKKKKKREREKREKKVIRSRRAVTDRHGGSFFTRAKRSARVRRHKIWIYHHRNAHRSDIFEIASTQKFFFFFFREKIMFTHKFLLPKADTLVEKKKYQVTLIEEFSRWNYRVLIRREYSNLRFFI